MKVEIKINEKGYCDYFKINGQSFGDKIYGYKIIHKAEDKPKLLIETSIDELIIDGENIEIYQEKEREEN